MPPKAKITKNMILNTVLEITQETGFETVNARSIASNYNVQHALYLLAMKTWRN